MTIFGITPSRCLLAILVCAAQSNASVIVQLKVVEGEGAIYAAGSRATRGLTVLVTDEAGKPVPNAAVSFRLPESGPSGVFSSGLRTEIVTTGADGRATVSGIQWNKTPGPVELRITAVKDEARAGIVSTQRLNETTIAPKATPAAGGQGVFTASHKGKGKWLAIAALAGGGAAAGLAFGRSHNNPTAAPPPVGLSIGAPNIILGHP